MTCITAVGEDETSAMKNFISNFERECRNRGYNTRDVYIDCTSSYHMMLFATIYNYNHKYISSFVSFTRRTHEGCELYSNIKF
jgi:hypothetical protein